MLYFDENRKRNNSFEEKLLSITLDYELKFEK